MKKNAIIYCFSLFFSQLNFGQNEIVDSLKTKELNEVIVIGKNKSAVNKQQKFLATIDEYLQKSSRIDMVKRGAYAWEPLINSMATERTLITIDGMRVFGACTDKMDPITSYVEISNLSEASVHSGQNGSSFGNTIGGSVDLKRTKYNFENTGWESSIQTGFESNNQQKIIGGKINYIDSLFYIGTNLMVRDANNYKAGDNIEVFYSQFKKWNYSSTIGFRINNKRIETSVIYDKASDIGYPALPMDVSLAEAILTSLKYEVVPKKVWIKNWETKFYYNTITHKMDDTTRPEVPIHMDMPGWSKTFGAYSKFLTLFNKQQITLNVNSFYNISLAEMTMYPNNPNESQMYMYTWPNIGTSYFGVFIEDNWDINCHQNLKLSINLANHNNKFRDSFGFQTIQIFYPNIAPSKSRFLASSSIGYTYHKEAIKFGGGVSYGSRAPSVSEGYGFYLFNSFDGFDYIGNPNLKNESVFETNFSIGYKKNKIESKMSGSYFYISNYIIGIPNSDLIPMTIGSNGVKEYKSFEYARQYTFDWTIEYSFSQFLKWNTQIVYNLGKNDKEENLPLIAPLSYSTSLSYKKNRFYTDIVLRGNATQKQYSLLFEEDKTASFAILNFSLGHIFEIYKNKLSLRAGIENILDAHYSTYSDWNNIPRQGRNIFINISYDIK